LSKELVKLPPKITAEAGDSKAAKAVTVVMNLTIVELEAGVIASLKRVTGTPTEERNAK